MENRNKVLRTADGESSSWWKGADLEYQKQLLGFDAKAAPLEGHRAWDEKKFTSSQNGSNKIQNACNGQDK